MNSKIKGFLAGIAKSAPFLLVFFTAWAMIVRFLAGSQWTELNWDTGLFLDGAWRVRQGQIPHIDFYSHVGPIVPLITAFGMQVRAGTANGIDAGIALAFLLPVVWAYLLSRSLLFTVLTTAYFITPRLYSGNWSRLAHTGLYNLIGYTFLILVCYDIFFPPPKTAAKTNFWRGVSTGAAMTLVFFVKMTFGLSAVFLVLAGLLIEGRPRPFFRGLIGGTALVALPLLAYLRFDLGMIFMNMASVAISRAEILGGQDHARFVQFLEVGAKSLSWLVALFLLTFDRNELAVSERRKQILKNGFRLVALWAGDLFLVFNCDQFPNEFVLYLFAAYWILSEILPTSSLTKLKKSPSRGIAVLLSVYLVAGSISTNLGGLLLLTKKLITVRPTAPHRPNFPGPIANTYSDLTMPFYFSCYSDGFRLLEGVLKPTDRIATVGLTDIFSFALGQPSARRAPLFWQYGGSFSKASREKFKEYRPENIFSEITILMILKTDLLKETRLRFQEIYGTYVEKHFDPLAEGRDWILLRKRSD